MKKYFLLLTSLIFLLIVAIIISLGVNLITAAPIPSDVLIPNNSICADFNYSLYIENPYCVIGDVINISIIKGEKSIFYANDSTGFDGLENSTLSLDIFMSKDYSYSYKYLGLIEDNVIFIPDRDGEYIVRLYLDKIPSSVIATGIDAITAINSGMSTRYILSEEHFIAYKQDAIANNDISNQLTQLNQDVLNPYDQYVLNQNIVGNSLIDSLPNQNYNIIRATAFSGSTTNFSKVNIENISRLTIDSPKYGKIVYVPNINLSNGANLDSSITLDYNLIRVDSSYEPRLNVSAILTMNNLPYEKSPIIYRDDVACLDCNIISYDSGTLIFEVTHFTSYTTGLNSNLTLWDESDPDGGNNLKQANESVKFFANYTNKTSGMSISGATCNISFSDSLADSALMSYNVSNSLYEYYRNFTAIGNYTWNVSCNGSSQGYESLSSLDNILINTTSPDISIYNNEISYDNVMLVEGNNITLYANITNLGLSNVIGTFIVQFYLGDPNLGGTQIGENISLTNLNIGEIKLVNTNYTLGAGLNNIFVYIDGNNDINESVESNNKADVNISVVMYQYYYGNIIANLLLGSSNNTIFFNTINITNFKGNIFITDADSVFSFTDLQALGRDVNNDSANDDFSDVDSNMNTSGFSDSVYNVWSGSTNIPILTKEFKITPLFTLHNVPVVNSSNDSNFGTGIVWDTSDDVSGNFQYDTMDKEDIVFVTSFDTTKTGNSGEHLYEIKVPALLRNYKGTTDKVALYYTLE